MRVTSPRNRSPSTTMATQPRSNSGSNPSAFTKGIFGFVLPGGDQIEITVEAGDLLRVPAGTEHWFRLGPRRTVVAVRLFGANPDWRADYTGAEILFPTE